LYDTEAIIEGTVGALLMGSPQIFCVVMKGKIIFFQVMKHLQETLTAVCF
jgi:hypothetical protein